jgi:hypothetical protein
MARTTQKESIQDTPTRFAETTPPPYPSSDHSFTLQTVMEMQKTLGQLTQTVTTLTEESKKCGDIIDKISHKVYAAEKVVVVVGIILGTLGSAAIYFLVEIWKTVSPLIQLKLSH